MNFETLQEIMEKDNIFSMKWEFNIFWFKRSDSMSIYIHTLIQVDGIWIRKLEL